MRHEAIGVMAVALGSLTLTLAPSARADMPPPEDYVETCTVEQQQAQGEVCLTCRASYLDLEACNRSCGALGFVKRCKAWGASVYNEVYCRSTSSLEPSDNACTRVEVGVVEGAGAGGQGSTETPGCVCVDSGTAGAATGTAGDSSLGTPGGAAGDDAAGAAGTHTGEDTGGMPGTGGDAGSSAGGKPGTGGNGGGGAVTGGTSGGDTGGTTGSSENTGGHTGEITGGASSDHSGGKSGEANGGSLGVGGKTGGTTGSTASNETGGNTDASKATDHHGGCSTAPGRSGSSLLLALVAFALGLRRRP